jgi:hypothetical protein
MRDERAPKGPHETTARKSGSNVSDLADIDTSMDHPRHGRPDAAELEARFRRDRDGWRRRIDCARRLTHDARDELVAPGGRWTP